jgi:NAD(P) transhydrogenase subunit beta
MSPNLSALLYLVSGVLFVLALRGLSHPTTSRQGNLFGMIGMGIAIVTTLAGHPPAGVAPWLLVMVALGIGGGIGAVVAKRVPMTAMPQLVAAFHSLVGLAAVLVAAGALYAPARLRDRELRERAHLRRLAVRDGDRGSDRRPDLHGLVIAFLKLDGRMSGKPIILPQRHALNIGLAVLLVILIVVLIQTESRFAFWMIVLVSFVLGVTLIIPIGGADMPVVVSMLNSYSGWAAAGIGFTLHNLASSSRARSSARRARSCPTSCARG